MSVDSYVRLSGVNQERSCAIVVHWLCTGLVVHCLCTSVNWQWNSCALVELCLCTSSALFTSHTSLYWSSSVHWKRYTILKKNGHYKQWLINMHCVPYIQKTKSLCPVQCALGALGKNASWRQWLSLAGDSSQSLMRPLQGDPRVDLRPLHRYLTIPYHAIGNIGIIPYHTILYLTIPFHIVSYHPKPYHTHPVHCRLRNRGTVTHLLKHYDAAL